MANAPVVADGGPGFNTFALVGTEAPDAFAVTSDDLCGAGRYAQCNRQSLTPTAARARICIGTCINEVQGRDNRYQFPTIRGVEC